LKKLTAPNLNKNLKNVLWWTKCNNFVPPVYST